MNFGFCFSLTSCLTIRLDCLFVIFFFLRYNCIVSFKKLFIKIRHISFKMYVREKEWKETYNKLHDGSYIVKIIL